MISRPYKQRLAYATGVGGTNVPSNIPGKLPQGSAPQSEQTGKLFEQAIKNDEEFKKLEDTGFIGYMTAQYFRVLCSIGRCPEHVQISRENAALNTTREELRRSDLQKARAEANPPSTIGGGNRPQLELLPQLLAAFTPQTASGATPSSAFKAGSSGNCSWDTKGGWCWNSTSCGGKCKICRTGYKTTNITQGCNAARSYFLSNASKCNSCKIRTPGSTVKPVTTPGITCKACAAGYIRASSTGCACKACSPCAKGYTRGSSGCSCKLCSPCKAGYIRGSSGCSCKACTPCRSGYHRGSSGCSCVINKFKCPYGGCSGTTSSSQCFLCRCRGICNNAAHGGVKSVSSNGSCFCNK